MKIMFTVNHTIIPGGCIRTYLYSVHVVHTHTDHSSAGGLSVVWQLTGTVAPQVSCDQEYYVHVCTRTPIHERMTCAIEGFLCCVCVCVCVLDAFILLMYM